MSSSTSTVTPLEHTLIGACSGALEVCIAQPLVGIKNALQEGRPIPSNPLHLYRGLLLNVMSMAPITASQFGTNRLMSGLLGKHDSELTGTERFGCAAVAGAASAFIASPSELIIIHQQKSGRSLVAETKHFLETHGMAQFRRGLLPAMGRETLYAAGYLGLFPMLTSELESRGLSPGTATVVAGLSGGMFAATASHPFDTAKTRMQAFMYDKPEYSTLRSTIGAVVDEGGILNLWRGLAPRMIRIIGATFILNWGRTTSVDYLEKSRAAK